MTYEQEHATKAMLRVYGALQALRDTATDVKALHMLELSDDQRTMINAIRTFAYADTISLSPKVTSGDGNAWRFQKFLVNHNENTQNKL